MVYIVFLVVGRFLVVGDRLLPTVCSRFLVGLLDLSCTPRLAKGLPEFSKLSRGNYVQMFWEPYKGVLGSSQLSFPCV